MTKQKHIKIVMLEELNDRGEWEWQNITTNDTPRKAIKRYLKDNELVNDTETIKFVKSENEPFDPCYAEAHDVRAFYIII